MNDVEKKESAVGRAPDGNSGANINHYPQNTTKTQKSQPTQIYAGGRVVGHVCDGIFFKRLSASSHQLRHPQAWAFDIDSLKAASDLGARYVVIHETDTNTRHTAAMSDIWAHGFVLDRGHGPQLALTIERWRIATTAAIQASLFEESEYA